MLEKCSYPWRTPGKTVTAKVEMVMTWCPWAPRARRRQSTTCDQDRQYSDQTVEESRSVHRWVLLWQRDRGFKEKKGSSPRYGQERPCRSNQEHAQDTKNSGRPAKPQAGKGGPNRISCSRTRAAAWRPSSFLAMEGRLSAKIKKASETAIEAVTLSRLTKDASPGPAAGSESGQQRVEFKSEA